jgi:hypothetical protein
MPVTVTNPYSGTDEPTCSVSFAAQNAVAGTTGSTQTEAEYNKSQQLGTIGVLQGKAAKGEIATGTKILEYVTKTGGERGYFTWENGFLYLTVIKKLKSGKDGKPKKTIAFWPQVEGYVKASVFVTKIPGGGLKPDPVKEEFIDGTYLYEQQKKGEAGKLDDQQVIAIHDNGDKLVWTAILGQFQWKEKIDGPTGAYFAVKNTASTPGAAIGFKPEGWKQVKADGTGPKTTPSPAAPPVAVPPSAPAVSTASASVGTMSHENVAAMFVLIKDKLATEKGVNIKGANAALDAEVYDAIAAKVGYTATEVKSKIDAYKAAGNKLSALKKKVLKDPSIANVAADPAPVGTPVAPKPKPAQAAAAATHDGFSPKEAKAKVDALGTTQAGGAGYLNGGTAAVGLEKLEGFFSNKLVAEMMKAKGLPPNAAANAHATFGKETLIPAGTKLYTTQDWLFSAVLKKYIANMPENKKAIVYKKDGKYIVADGNHMSAAAILTNKPVLAQVLDLDNYDTAPTVATPDIAEAAAAVVTEAVTANPTKVYSDEDIAGAFIIAKDKIVAESGGKWTLYTKSEELDKAIADEVEAKTGYTQAKQKAAVAAYLATGKKLSGLKKTLAKQGAFIPKADTMKSGANSPATASTTSTPTAAATSAINTHATAGTVPSGTATTTSGTSGTTPSPVATPAPSATAAEKARKAGDISKVSQDEQLKIYQAFKALGSKAYADTAEDTLYDSFSLIALQNKLTKLQVVRIVDAQGAKKFNVANGNIFEKKMVAWLTTPAGKAYPALAAEKLIKAAKDAEEKKLAAKKAEELRNNQPPLPADSAQFKVVSKTEMTEWREKRTKAMTADQKAALKKYTGSSYTSMNAYLRSDLKTNKTERNSSRKAIDGMRKTDRPWLFHRGTSPLQFGLDIKDVNGIYGLVGKTLEDKAFVSTSFGGNAAFGGSVQMEFQAPPGTQGQFVSDFSQYQSENEFLLQAGTRYTILRVEDKGPNKVKVIVRIEVDNYRDYSAL